MPASKHGIQRLVTNLVSPRRDSVWLIPLLVAQVALIFGCVIFLSRRYPWYWSGTTLLDGPSSESGVYVCFGRAMGYMNGRWMDVHGAGAQRSDPKVGPITNDTRLWTPARTG
jgi:hypothetical protein